MPVPLRFPNQAFHRQSDRIGREETVDEIEILVSQMIAECAEQLQQEKIRLEKLKADNGISEMPTYTHPREFVAKIASPQIAQFVELIRLLDQLMIVMDILWLCQVISTSILPRSVKLNVRFRSAVPGDAKPAFSSALLWC